MDDRQFHKETSELAVRLFDTAKGTLQASPPSKERVLVVLNALGIVAGTVIAAAPESQWFFMASVASQVEQALKEAAPHADSPADAG